MRKGKSGFFSSSVRVPFIVLCVSLAFNIIFFVREYQSNRVVAVPDGDSLDVADGRRVRLLGLDAPEIGRCMSREARDRLAEIALGKHIRLKNIVRDDYGRILANVIVEEPVEWGKYLIWYFGKNLGFTLSEKPDPMLNMVIVKEGLAKFTFAGSIYYKVLKEAHQIAMTKKIGIYSPDCRQMVAPNPSCGIKANIRNGKKLYHLPACSNYSDVIVDTSFGDQWFCSEEEARRADFTRASGCF